MERNKLATLIAILFFLSLILGLFAVFSQPSLKKEEKSGLHISQDKIVIVNIYGPIMGSSKSPDPFSHDSDKIVRQLKKIK